MNDSKVKRFVSEKRARQIFAVLALAAVCIIVVVIRIVRVSNIPRPQGEIIEITFCLNPRQLAKNLDVPVDGTGLVDQEFYIDVGADLIGLEAGKLFERASSGKRAYRVYWSYPFCRVVTETGGYTLRLGRESIEEVLAPANEAGQIRFLYDRGMGEPSSRLHSSRLSRAIVQAVQKNPELVDQINLLSRHITEYYKQWSIDFDKKYPRR